MANTFNKSQTELTDMIACKIKDGHLSQVEILEALIPIVSAACAAFESEYGKGDEILAACNNDMRELYAYIIAEERNLLKGEKVGAQ